MTLAGQFSFFKSTVNLGLQRMEGKTMESFSHQARGMDMVKCRRQNKTCIKTNPKPRQYNNIDWVLGCFPPLHLEPSLKLKTTIVPAQPKWTDSWKINAVVFLCPFPMPLTHPTPKQQFGGALTAKRQCCLREGISDKSSSCFRSTS